MPWNHAIMVEYPIPILGFAAWSGTGKTTLLTKLIPLLNAKGLKVGLIKHAHHTFTIDQPGKDSYCLREAGAAQVIIASKNCTATIMDTIDNDIEPRLEDALRAINNTQQLDLLLIEGFKKAAIPKIELHRVALGKPYLHPDDPLIIALAEDRKSADTALPLLDLNQPEHIADYIQLWLEGAV